MPERKLPTEPIEAILVFDDPRDWSRDLQICCDVLRSDGYPVSRPLVSDGGQRVPIYLSNPDLVYAGGYHVPRLAQGAFRVSLETLYHRLTGRSLEFTQYGKPTRKTYDYARNVLQDQLGEDASELSAIYAIGDNPRADVAGANGAGKPWVSVLVRTGVFGHAQLNDEEHPAHFVMENVEHAVDFVLSHHA